MTTDEMILALVATGKFTLPAGVTWHKHSKDWQYYCRSYKRNPSPIYDLCACHFAREARHLGWPIGVTANEKMRDDMKVGDSAAAIEALWRATQ